jgi:hypothetical protein
MDSGSTANVEQERATLMRLDREWAASVKDMDKFMSYYASDASLYPPGMPLARIDSNPRGSHKDVLDPGILFGIWPHQSRCRCLR